MKSSELLGGIIVGATFILVITFFLQVLGIIPY